MADNTIHATVSIACNNVLASYKAVQQFLNIAIKSPVAILKLIDAQVTILQTTAIGGISNITANIVGVADDLANYLNRIDIDVDVIRNALLCPLITSFMDDDKLNEYLTWVEDFIAGVDKVNSYTQKMNNTLYTGIVKQQTFLIDNMNDLLNEEVYARINSMITTVEQAYWADLGFIHPSLKGESIMSLLGYLRMGEVCLKAYCDTITKVGLQEVSDYIEILRLTDFDDTTFKFDPYKTMPHDVAQACIDAGQETQDAIDHLDSTFGKFNENIEPVDPYKVDSWVITD